MFPTFWTGHEASSAKRFVQLNINSNAHILCLIGLPGSFIHLKKNTYCASYIFAYLLIHELKRKTLDLNPERRVSKDNVCRDKTGFPVI